VIHDLALPLMATLEGYSGSLGYQSIISSTWSAVGSRNKCLDSLYIYKEWRCKRDIMEVVAWGALILAV